MLAAGAFLEDVNRREQRFRIKELLHDAGDYQIALAEDSAMDDKLVCVKTIAYDSGLLNDKKHVAMRRKALHQELEFLAEPLHLLPEPLDWIQLAESSAILEREPVLVYEYVSGDSLYELISSKFPSGIAPTRALRITRELASFLAELHQAKWVFRNLDPRHVIVGHDDVIHLVGCGNASRMGEAPNVTRASLESPYVAPEARNELSGKFLRPAADIYSLGALLSFMLTGEEPRESVENPLSKDAFDRLSELEPPGLSLIVARCLRPMAKERFGRAEKLLPFLENGKLPTPNTEGFGLMTLPAPWSGAERPDGRLAKNRLSAGPLLSVEKAQPAEPEQSTALEKAPTAAERALAENPTKDRSALYYVAFLLFAVILCALSFLLPL